MSSTNEEKVDGDEIAEISANPLSAQFDLMYNKIDDKPLVAKKTHVPFIYAIAMMVVTSLVFMGVSSLSGIMSDITMLFTDFLYAFTGLPPILSSLILGIAALGLAAIILIAANRGREGAERIIEGTQIIMDTEPDEYFDLDIVSSTYLVDELLDRGCTGKLNEEGGFTIMCPDHPVTEKMREVIEGFDDKHQRQQKIMLFAIFNAVLIIFVLFFRWSSDAYASSLIEETYEFLGLSVTIGQWVFIALYIFVLGLMIEFRIVPLWVVTVIIAPAYLIVTKCLVPLFPNETFMVLMALLICVIIVTFVIYSFRPYMCTEKEVWYCDRL